MGKRRLNGEGNIRQRADGRYESRVSGGIDYRTGRPVRISQYSNTQEEAIHKLNKMNLAVGNHNIVNQNITLGEWLDLWLEVYMKNSLKQSTYMGYETYCKKHFKPALGHMLLSDITPMVLRQFYNYKMNCENLSTKTISNINLCLHKALDQACKEGLIASNPASSLNLPKAHRPEIQILNRDEQAVLFRASYNHRYGVFVRLVLATGLRLGELLGLMWEDLDLRRSMLHIKRTLNRVQIPGLPDNYSGPRTQIVIQEPKSEASYRSIPLIPGVIQDLMQWKAIQDTDRAAAGDAYIESGMIVTNPNGGYIEPRTFSDYYHQILQMAGIGHYTFHALRHTFATRALEQGMDFKTVSALMGHTSVAFTMDSYTHVLDEHKREGMKLMEDLYTIDQTVPMQQLYPVVFAPSEDGGFIVSAPDFPSIELYAPTMEDGYAQISDAIREQLVGMRIPPAPTNLTTIAPAPGKMLMQIAV